MKKIITMVGTSIFENYLEEEKNQGIKNYCEDLKKERAKEYDSEKGKIDKIKKEIQEWIKKKGNIKNASAEVKSLLKIKEELNNEFEIYLLCSDTILSKVGGELLKEEILPMIGFDKNKIFIEIIGGLQIWDRKEFNEGMGNLINEIYKIADEYWENVIINITGGYKATIPYLTILAQINKCSIYYIFEDTDALIKIPYLPLDIKWSLFEKYENFFRKLEKEQIQELKDIKYEDIEDIKSLLEIVDNLYSFNPLGMTLWKRYKQNFELFYISRLFKEYIEKDPNYEKIANKSLLELKRRINLNPNDPDLDHKLQGIDFGGFKCFKHKEENLQVRILYKKEEWETKYKSIEYDLYIGLICIGSDVHNVENEYVEDFKRNFEKIKDIKEYELHKIKKEV